MLHRHLSKKCNMLQNCNTKIPTGVNQKMAKSKIPQKIEKTRVRRIKIKEDIYFSNLGGGDINKGLKKAQNMIDQLHKDPSEIFIKDFARIENHIDEFYSDSDNYRDIKITFQNVQTFMLHAFSNGGTGPPPTRQPRPAARESCAVAVPAESTTAFAFWAHGRSR